MGSAAAPVGASAAGRRPPDRLPAQQSRATSLYQLLETHFETLKWARFLMLKPVESQASAPTRIQVVLNWFEELKQKSP